MTRRSHSFSLPLHVLDDLRRLAEERDESMSFFLREALREYLRQHLPGHAQRSGGEEQKRT
jgi:predicted transcriptional regulator